MTISIEATASGATGFWSVRATNRNPYGQVQTVDITYLRNVPTQIGEVHTTEPYGPATATLTFPAVSALEPFGNSSSDLWWLRDGSEIEIAWRAVDPSYVEALNTDYVRRGNLTGDPTRYIWEGRLVSIDAQTNGNGVTVQCVGAIRVLDNYLAQPMSSARPTPVENAIVRAFQKADERHPTGLKPLLFIPDPATAQVYDDTIYQKKRNSRNRKRKAWYLRPRGLTQNQLWTGLTTRNLGDWNRVLTEFTDPLLKMMRTQYGLYTMRLMPGRFPVLRHRSTVYHSGEPVIVVNLIAPGVEASVSYDYSQTLTTVYGKANAALAGSTGTTYDGTMYAADGQSYWFKPFATTPWVDPDYGNGERDVWAMRREVYDEFPGGMQVSEAMMVARRHLSMNGDTGVTGTLTLTSVDPQVVVGGVDSYRRQLPFPKQMIMPGAYLRLDGLHGAIPGPLVMATEVTHSPEADSVSITFDSKFRDYTTVREIRLRTRDALKPTHSLVLPSNFKLNIDDPLIPWSYTKGCGYFPVTSKLLWNMYLHNPENTDPEFPGTCDINDDENVTGWYAMTTKFPPKRYPRFYSKVSKSPTGHRGTKKNPLDPAVFWNAPETIKNNTDTSTFSVLLSERGTIDHVEFIAVDENGLPMPVSYHISIWRGRVGSKSTPLLPSSPDDEPQNVIKEYTYKENGKVHKVLRYHTEAGNRWYRKDTPYPFYKRAWDQIDQFGRTMTGRTDLEGMYVGWGNHYEKCGYFPGSSRLGNEPTGVFADSNEWTYSQFEREGFRNDDDYDKDSTETDIATAYILIFCDHMPSKDIYFIGRLYKREGELA